MILKQSDSWRPNSTFQEILLKYLKKKTKKNKKK